MILSLKRNEIIILCCLLLGAVFCAYNCFKKLPESINRQSINITIGSVSTKSSGVRIKGKSTLEWDFLSFRANVFNEDRLFTDEKSRAKIELGSNILVEIAPESLIVITAPEGMASDDFGFAKFFDQFKSTILKTLLFAGLQNIFPAAFAETSARYLASNGYSIEVFKGSVKISDPNADTTVALVSKKGSGSDSDPAEPIELRANLHSELVREVATENEPIPAVEVDLLKIPRAQLKQKGLELYVLSRCDVRNASKIEPNNVVLKINSGPQKIVVYPLDFQWAVIELKDLKELWVEKKCFTQLKNGGQSCDLKDAKNRIRNAKIMASGMPILRIEKNRVFLNFTNQDFFVDASCFGQPLMNSNAFYENLIQICSQESNALKPAICEFAFKNKPQAETTISETKSNQYKASNKSFSLKLTQGFSNLEQRGGPVLKFKKFTEPSFLLNGRFDFDEKSAISASFARNVIVSDDVGFSARLGRLEIDYSTRFLALPDYLEFDFGIYSDQQPLLITGNCNVGCGSFTSTGFQTAVRVKHSLSIFPKLENSLFLGLKRPVLSGEFIEIQNSLHYVVSNQVTYRFSEKWAIPLSLSYEVLKMDLLLRPISTDAALDIKNWVLGIGAQYHWD